MAVRGIAGFLLIYPELTPPGTLELYAFQNYFPGTINDGIQDYDYRAFQLSPFVEDKNSTSSEFTVTFPATAANVDLVEECLTNRYIIAGLVQRWSSTEGLESPTGFNIFSLATGNAVSASADMTTVSLTVRPYADAIDADVPWRKVPWTILGPLSLGA